MFRSTLVVSFLFVLVAATPNIHISNESSLTSCDLATIKQLISEVVSLTSDTVSNVTGNVVAAVTDLAYCLWFPDLYSCLEGDMEYAILDNLQQAASELKSYANTVPTIVAQIAEDVAACA